MSTRTHTTPDLHVERWGTGTPVVLVHGSLATGADEWDAQRPLADEGFSLVVFDRRGYGGSQSASAEDFLTDADDIADLLRELGAAHLVGHSYGGLGAMLAAASVPERVLSLTLLEPAAAAAGTDHVDWRQVVDDVRRFWSDELDDEAWAVRFLTAVGSDPTELPPELLAAAIELVPVFRNGRPFYDAELPFDELLAAPFPKLVVSGGHNGGFDAMCDDLARRIEATRLEVAGAGHEIQFAGAPLNNHLAAMWRDLEGSRS
jgi:pimeloyl-ACP methyl ester carboxylesterase